MARRKLVIAGLVVTTFMASWLGYEFREVNKLHATTTTKIEVAQQKISGIEKILSEIKAEEETPNVSLEDKKTPNFWFEENKDLENPYLTLKQRVESMPSRDLGITILDYFKVPKSNLVNKVDEKRFVDESLGDEYHFQLYIASIGGEEFLYSELSGVRGGVPVRGIQYRTKDFDVRVVQEEDFFLMKINDEEIDLIEYLTPTINNFWLEPRADYNNPVQTFLFRAKKNRLSNSGWTNKTPTSYVEMPEELLGELIVKDAKNEGEVFSRIETYKPLVEGITSYSYTRMLNSIGKWAHVISYELENGEKISFWDYPLNGKINFVFNE
ncbi:hypothetical protein GOV05_04375 [Candidatus Woesearchaeota archaeon]|nr:hypothetical protein [Candidatus Woesearchaeota archaeon]